MAILAYILGIMTGIALAIVAAHFAKTRPEAVERIVSRGYPLPADFKTGEGVEFLDPGDDAQDAMEEVIEEHEKSGEHTPLEEIS